MCAARRRCGHLCLTAVWYWPGCRKAASSRDLASLHASGQRGTACAKPRCIFPSSASFQVSQTHNCTNTRQSSCPLGHAQRTPRAPPRRQGSGARTTEDCCLSNLGVALALGLLLGTASKIVMMALGGNAAQRERERESVQQVQECVLLAKAHYQKRKNQLTMHLGTVGIRTPSRSCWTRPP